MSEKKTVVLLAGGRAFGRMEFIRQQIEAAQRAGDHVIVLGGQVPPQPPDPKEINEFMKNDTPRPMPQGRIIRESPWDSLRRLEDRTKALYEVEQAQPASDERDRRLWILRHQLERIKRAMGRNPQGERKQPRPDFIAGQQVVIVDEFGQSAAIVRRVKRDGRVTVETLKDVYGVGDIVRIGEFDFRVAFSSSNTVGLKVLTCGQIAALKEIAAKPQEPLPVAARDAEFVACRKFNTDQIAKMYRVPPEKMLPNGLTASQEARRLRKLRRRAGWIAKRTLNRLQSSQGPQAMPSTLGALISR